MKNTDLEKTPAIQLEEEKVDGVKSITLDDISKEELIGIISDLQIQLEEKERPNTFITEPLLIMDDELEELMKSPEFIEGLKVGAKLAGIYTGLVNCGMSLETAQDIAVNHHTLTLNTEALKIQQKTLKRSSGV